MHSNVAVNNVSWPHFSWPTLYVVCQLSVVTVKGQEVRLQGVRLDELLPATSDYVTYDGSLTQPGCQETVTWLLLNKPIYVTRRHVRAPLNHRHLFSLVLMLSLFLLLQKCVIKFLASLNF